MRAELLYRNCTQKQGTKDPLGPAPGALSTRTPSGSSQGRPLRGLTASSVDRVQPSSEQTWVFTDTKLKHIYTHTHTTHTHIQTLCTHTHATPAREEAQSAHGTVQDFRDGGQSPHKHMTVLLLLGGLTHKRASIKHVPSLLNVLLRTTLWLSLRSLVSTLANFHIPLSSCPKLSGDGQRRNPSSADRKSII